MKPPAAQMLLASVEADLSPRPPNALCFAPRHALVVDAPHRHQELVMDLQCGMAVLYEDGKRERRLTVDGPLSDLDRRLQAARVRPAEPQAERKLLHAEGEFLFVRGPLDPDYLRTHVQHVSGADNCYRDAIWEDPSVSGSVDIMFTVPGAGGDASAVSTKAQDSLLPVAQCMKTYVEQHRFPRAPLAPKAKVRGPTRVGQRYKFFTSDPR